MFKKTGDAAPVYILEEPTHVGTISPRVELLANPTESRAVGFACTIYQGSEVYLIKEDQPVQEPILEKDGLKDGDSVLCPSLMGYFKATVSISEDGTVSASNGNQAGFLEFDKDDRHCWICSSTFNLKGILKLNLSQ